MRTKKEPKEKYSIYYLCGFIIFISLLLINFSLYLNRKTKIVVLGSQDSTYNEIAFWTNLLKTYPTYKEGWISLARLEYKKGNLPLAVTALDYASKIDPNSEEIKLTKKEFGLLE